ncbi:ubiquinol-cytochrome c reductase core subunit 1 [Coemansia sp. RSA 1813]|nr:ubiquinol-cytochrome c reductase core subunit 1 [Coemansia sp. RSA 1646]KAJ1768817.1 ubiquinol-cytochrome c reductase core subunit 1 [Coemansia sp. RSA 1843]KAJ2087217.1 ubiquinol-cytochrome c reductase core subunit 1 [Coemansia sp. RSA 986]KAJ2210940.1 ubiquinol-cytochrome c reductase core subunit 1 [Coemansia sp. RSA 487]KAJ2566202.1 ubiquinol-cytochrome c reductase core subunit 1 [Coemansia sp. RSA 1813]
MFRAKSIAKVARRTYASVASAPVVSTSNGIKVAAIEGDAESQLASVSLVINGGSRFEAPENAGAAHYLKAFGFRNTQGRTSFRTVREAELNGATLVAEATRENITYTVQCFKDAVPYFVDVLADIATATKYAEHEFRDISKAVIFESLCAHTNPVTRLVDGIHQAAFRNGLGNSLYALSSSPVTTGDAVRQYAQAAFASNRVAIVGTGVGAQQLADLVSQSSLSGLGSQSSLTTSASKFVGGTQQVYESASPVSHYALAFSAEPGMAPVLASLLGAQKRMKWSTGVSPLAKLAASEGFEAEAFSFAYSDAGVVGVLVSAPTSQIKGAMEKVAAVIQKDIAAAGDEAVQRAVAAAKVDAAETLATLKGTQLALGQVALGQSAATLESVEQAASKLSSAAPAVFKSKPVAASVGLSQTTAYVDTLGF